MAEILKALAPFGLSAVAILFVYLIYLKSGAHQKLFGLLAIGCILLLALLDILFPRPKIIPAVPESKGGAPTVPPTPAAGVISWFDTTISADWAGRDRAFTKESIPKYSVSGADLCSENRLGYVAVCWDTRPSGYPGGVPNDLNGAITPSWCTYKGPEIRLSTPPDGRAPPGRVFLCSRDVSR